MNYEQKYLEILAKEYPNVQRASSELINLTAILNLPKGTEIFITDIHGEYDAFNHYLKNASGIIKAKIDQIYPSLSDQYRNRLAFFIYYPTDMINKYAKQFGSDEFAKLIRHQLMQMVEISRHLASKYTKSKVRKMLDEEFSYIIQELIFESQMHEDKQRYYEAIVDAIFATKREGKFIVQMSKFIRTLAIDQLHIIGDIFDRGAKPHLVMERMMQRTNVDIQWGNHDISFMGAASGSQVMIANVIRIAARYNNLDALEDGYGLNLIPLARMAYKFYQHDPCTPFLPRGERSQNNQEEDIHFVAKVHKAIAVIQFKLERDIIRRHPEFKMDDRLLLHHINLIEKTLVIDGVSYPLEDIHFPTVDFANDPYALCVEELDVINHLTQSFLHNEMVQSHVRFLFQQGSMYLKYNGNLLFHAVIPMESTGEFMSFPIDGLPYSGRSLMEQLERKIRRAYFNRYERLNFETDYFYMLWQNPVSPLFGKHAMKTFERYFLKEKGTHKEIINPYFELRKEEKHLRKIYEEFDLDFAHSKIINGHVPVDITHGDDVILANKRIYNIDGGMSHQFSDQTSMAGYSLISDSYAYFLVSHERFESYLDLIASENDIISITRSEEINSERTYIYDTDKGVVIKDQIQGLKRLLEAYRSGLIKESTK